MSSPTTLILSDELIHAVIQYNPALISAPHNGWRKLSAYLLSPPDPSDPSSYPPPSPSTSTSQALTLPPHPDGYPDLKIPMSMFSEQTLQFIGFDQPTSATLLLRWTQSGGSGLEAFESMVFEYLKNSAVCCRSGEVGWRERMEETGIEKKLQDSILDPEFADVCGTRSLECWVRETLLDNWLVVKGMEGRVGRVLGLIVEGRRRGREDRGGRE